ncbi:MAG: aminotransferase class I/II-fold pyridoxal phosphate-dependent enzyme [Spirochaetota bacterium]
MNALANELNDTLQGTVAGRLLSALGRKMYFPKGIVAQTSEANERASRFNATVGMAFEDGEPIMLSGLGSLVNGLSPREAVAYAPTPGVPELRRLWREEMERKNPSLGSTPTTLPMVTGGLTNGLFQISELFIDTGDALVLPRLFWGNYRLMIGVRREADIVEYDLFTEEGRFNVAGLERAIGERNKAVVLLNFPNNPTGYTPTIEEAAAIEALLVSKADAGCDLLVICDDAYFGLFYEEGLLEESLFARLAPAHERILAVKIDGATKEDFAWGFRVGFVTVAGKGLGREELGALERKLMGSIRSTVSNSSRIAQSMLVRALASDGYQREKLAKRELLKRRYERVQAIIAAADTGPLAPLPFNSGYFMAFACTGVSAEALRLALLDEGIGTIAIGEEYLRVAYSTIDEKDLEELYDAVFAAAKRLAAGS